MGKGVWNQVQRKTSKDIKNPGNKLFHLDDNNRQNQADTTGREQKAEHKIRKIKSTKQGHSQESNKGQNVQPHKKPPGERGAAQTQGEK